MSHTIRTLKHGTIYRMHYLFSENIDPRQDSRVPDPRSQAGGRVRHLRGGRCSGRRGLQRLAQILQGGTDNRLFCIICSHVYTLYRSMI